MKTTQFIPEKVRIHQRRAGSDVPRGIPIPNSTTPEVQRLIKKKIGEWADCLEYDNKPLGGYHIMIERDTVQVFHPDGFALNLTMYNIGILLRESNINQGIISDELIFVFDTSFSEYVLLPVDKDSYNEVKVYSANYFNAKTGTDALTYGCTITVRGNKFRYLGTKWMTSLSLDMKISTVERMLVARKYEYPGSTMEYYLLAKTAPDCVSDELTFDIPCDEETAFTDSTKVKNKIFLIKGFLKSDSINAQWTHTKYLHFDKVKPKKGEYVTEFKKVNICYDYRSIFKSTDGNYYYAVSGSSYRYNSKEYAFRKEKRTPHMHYSVNVDPVTFDMVKEAKVQREVDYCVDIVLRKKV